MDIIKELGSTASLEIQLAEQNVYANWIRNAMIATLVAMVVFGQIYLGLQSSLDPKHKWIRIGLKIVGGSILLLVIFMLYQSTTLSRNFHSGIIGGYPANLYHRVGYFLMIPVLVLLILLIFI